jgi:hypothetical protein
LWTEDLSILFLRWNWMLWHIRKWQNWDSPSPRPPENRLGPHNWRLNEPWRNLRWCGAFKVFILPFILSVQGTKLYSVLP